MSNKLLVIEICVEKDALFTRSRINGPGAIDAILITDYRAA